MAAGPRPGRLPALRRPGGRRRDRGQAGGHAAVGRGVAVARCTPRGCRRTCAWRRSRWTGGCPFVFEASGTETHFTNGFDPDPRARRLFNFPQAGDPRPASCATPRPTRSTRPGAARSRALPRAGRRAAAPGADRRRSTASSGASPSSATTAAWSRWPPARARPTPPSRSPTGCSSTAASTGSCSSSTATTSPTRRWREFQNYRTPDDGRRFTELYNVDKLTSAGMLGSTSVVDLHHPAGLQGAAQRGGRRQRRSRAGRLRARRPGHGRLQPRHPARDVRPGHRRRGAPLDLRRVARRAGVLRRPRRRPDRHPGQADVRVLPAEPGLGVHLPAVGRRQRQRRLRRLPDQAPRSASRARPSRPAPSSRRSTAAPARSGYEALDEDLEYTPQPARPGRHRDATRSAPCSRPSATGCSPRSSPAARRCRRR